MSLTKTAFALLWAALLFSPITAHEIPHSPQAEHAAPKNTVIVLGMIHSRHKDSERYSLPIVEKVIRDINPDYVLTEIPPDRLAQAAMGFAKDGVVSESRVKVFPEYKDVLFPLSLEMDFKIIPTAAWTRGMADYRRKGLNAIKENETRAADWDAYQEANKAYNDALGERRDDPLFIHSQRYDDIIKDGLSVYAERFANDLGRGDWESINAGHYKLIEAALENHSGEGATLLITYGAAHKYWFLEQLRKRDDIILVNPSSYFEALD